MRGSFWYGSSVTCSGVGPVISTLPSGAVAVIFTSLGMLSQTL